jgi:hypothetical protein
MTSSLRQAGAALRHRAKHWLGRHPALYHEVYRLRDGFVDRLVTDETDLCVEGFPRSANSFAVGAFEYAQPEPLSIAHHNHVPAPLLNAARRGLPALVLIRDPVDTVISNRGLQLQIAAQEGTEGPAHVPYTRQLRTWIAWHERVWPVRDQAVVAPFAVVTDDFGRVMDAVNARFGTDFTRFEHTEENVAAIRGARGYHALPTAERDRLKARARERFAAAVGADHPLVEEAHAVYRRFVEASSVPSGS